MIIEILVYIMAISVILYLIMDIPDIILLKRLRAADYKLSVPQITRWIFVLKIINHIFLLCFILLAFATGFCLVALIVRVVEFLPGS